MHSFSLVDKASVSEARQLVRSQLNGLGVEPSLSFECVLAMTEACTNALIHGADEGAPPPELSWVIDERSASFSIRDYSSQTWSPPAPTSDRSHDLDDLQPGGLGIEIMRDLMDEVTIVRSHPGAEVSMTKYLSQVRVRA
ncbi:MAG: ATP-binding protein [Actinomycetota bacterium]|nr:ATP-binding protein [Actinomycetota bacterium]